VTSPGKVCGIFSFSLSQARAEGESSPPRFSPTNPKGKFWTPQSRSQLFQFLRYPRPSEPTINTLVCPSILNKTLDRVNTKYSTKEKKKQDHTSREKKHDNIHEQIPLVPDGPREWRSAIFGVYRIGIGILSPLKHLY